MYVCYMWILWIWNEYLLLCFFQPFFYKTNESQFARAAKILGVDTEKVYAATFGINAALCGVAGALISITFTIALLSESLNIEFIQ